MGQKLTHGEICAPYVYSKKHAFNLVYIISFTVILDNAFDFTDKATNDFVKLSGMSNSLTQFTVCLWMSSTNSEGSPFSYAVSSEANELLIYYKNQFQLSIGGEATR